MLLYKKFNSMNNIICNEQSVSDSSEGRNIYQLSVLADLDKSSLENINSLVSKFLQNANNNANKLLLSGNKNKYLEISIVCSINDIVSNEVD